MDVGGHFISKIFHPSCVKNVTFDEKSYIIDNKRRFILSGTIHYPRVPREEWEERIALAKSNGLNTIQSYVFWNVHEPKEGEFYFEDYADLEYFIQLIKKYGLFMIIRIGPYVNAERDNGGFPKWLAKYDCKVRVDDEVYLKFVYRYYEKILDIVKRNSYPNGGPIIALQYENEVLWDESIPYLEKLKQFVEDRVDDIILIESGMFHEGGLSLGDGISKIYHNTEMWMGWLFRWGENVLPAQTGVETVSKIYQGVARGVDGFNYYMYSGGTNFDYSQSSAYPTCYELGEAPLNEQGTPTRLYEESHLINNFIKSFEDELTDSSPFLDLELKQQNDVDIENWGVVNSSLGTKFIFGFGEGTFGEVFGYNLDYKYSKDKPACFVFDFTSQGEKIEYAGPNILFRNDKILYLYADVGEDIKIRFGGKNISVYVDSKDFYQKMNILSKLDVYVASREMAKKSFLINNEVIVGIDFNVSNSYYYKLKNIINRDEVIYKKGKNLKEIKSTIKELNIDFNLKKIAEYSAVPDINLDDDSPLWIKSDKILAIDDIAPSDRDYMWYRFIINAEKTYSKVMFFENVQDQVFIWFNGKFHQSSLPTIWDGRSFKNKINVSFTVHKGRNVVDVLLKSWGRYKGFSVGNETLKEAGQIKTIELSNMHFFNFSSEVRHLCGLAIEDREHLIDKTAPIGEAGNVFEFSFDYPSADNYVIKPRVNIGKSSLTHGVLYINGRNIGRYFNKGYEKKRGYNLPYKWLKPKDNKLVIYEDLDGKPDNIYIDISLDASYYLI